MDELEFKFHPDFFKDLDKLEKRDLEAINKQIEKIKQNPLRFKRLHGGDDCFSVRFGKLRIIYFVDDKIVWFLLVERRKKVYEEYLKRLYKIKAQFE